MELHHLLDDCEFIDLSFPLSARSPYWKTHLPLVFQPLKKPGSYPDPDHPYYLNLLLIGEHTGTHVDAPCHNLAFPGKGQPFGTIGTPPHRSVDQLEVGAFSGMAVVIDISLFIESKPIALTVDHLLEWEKRFGRIPDGTVVLINTGYYRRWHDLPDGAAYMDGLWSGFSAEAVGWLHRERGVEAVGSDAATIEPSGPGAVPDVHSTACSQGMRIIECLNYATLETRHLTKPWWFTLLCFPLRIVGGSGSPVRAVALVRRS